MKVFKAGLLVASVAALAGCSTSSSHKGEPLEPHPAYQHSTDVSWVEPPKELIEAAGDLSDYIVANPNRVDRFLGKVPFEDLPNHWEHDIHAGAIQMESVRWRQEVEGKRIQEKVISYDQKGRVVNIDFIGKISGPIQYQYAGPLSAPVQKISYDQHGDPITTYYYRDRYGNFMGVSSPKGEGKVKRDMVSYRNIRDKFVVTLRAKLPTRQADDGSLMAASDALWRYDVRLMPPYSYPEYIRIAEHSEQVTEISERITEIWHSPQGHVARGDFDGRVISATHQGGDIIRKDSIRYTEGERLSYESESGDTVESRVYSHYQYDNKGNWVSRDVTVHRTGEPPQTLRETRHIEYR